ncbi:MAG: glycosyltransferase [Candidatus Spechtbacteria bacterium]|nr:glycosyltransferase [Candidatus Spechtbacteria bacterium]
MKNFTEKETIHFLPFYFWMIILGMRLFIFVSEKLYQQSPMLIIHGVHIHHFFLGLALLLIAFILFDPKRIKNSLVFMAFIGIGSGLFFDEFSFWAYIRSRNYWSLENLIAIAAVGSFFIYYARLQNRRKKPAILFPIHPRPNPQNPLVSVVIPAFNEEKFLTHTLWSIIRQDFQNFELIVVDNNSKDATTEIAKRFGAKVVFEAKRGVGFARQKGFCQARGSIIATTDADTLAPQNWLQRIVTEFQKDRAIVAFGGLYTLCSGPFTARFATRYLLYPAWILDKTCSGGWTLPGANFAVRKNAFYQIGGFNTKLHLGEDADLSQRLRKTGQVILDPRFRVQTSGRRFKNGLLLALVTYAPNGIIRMLLKKHKLANLPTIRNETPFLQRFLLLPVSLGIVSLAFLFYIANPPVSHAKEVAQVRKKITSVVGVLEKQEATLKNSLEGIKHTQWKQKR